MPSLIREEDQYALNISDCKGSAFFDALKKVQSVEGSWFDWDRKVWIIPPEPGAVERVLLSIQPEADGSIREWVHQARAKDAEDLTTVLPDDAELLIPWATQRMPWQPETVNGQPFTGLMRHQRPATDWLARHPKAILADDMGLGKTIQAISAFIEWSLREGLASLGNDGRPVFARPGSKIIVSPNSVKGTWAREVHRWLGTDEPFQIIDASAFKSRHNQIVRGIQDRAWIVVNYEQLRVVKKKVKLSNGGEKQIKVPKEPLLAYPQLHEIPLDELQAAKPDWLKRRADKLPEGGHLAALADEIHRAKNKNAAQTQGLWLVRAPFMLGLTGTPVMNSPDELWALLHWLWPKEYTSYWGFYEKYVDYYEGYHGKVITGVRNPDALRFELKQRLIRRTKHQVLDLPGKMRITVPVDMNPKQRELYDRAVTELWLEVEKAVEAGDADAIKFAAAAAAGEPVSTLYRLPNGAARTVRLRQVLSSPSLLGGEDDSAKLDAAVDRITDNAHHQHIVFSEFVPTCDLLAARLRKHGLRVETYTGRTKDRDRTELEESYQRGEIDVLIGTIKAMNTGLTLTSGFNQHWLERDWNPKQNEQGEDRQDRIGQTEKVMVYIYEGTDSVDDGKIAPTNRLKERIAQTVVPHDPIEEVVATP